MAVDRIRALAGSRSQSARDGITSLSAMYRSAVASATCKPFSNQKTHHTIEKRGGLLHTWMGGMRVTDYLEFGGWVRIWREVGCAEPAIQKISPPAKPDPTLHWQEVASAGPPSRPPAHNTTTHPPPSTPAFCGLPARRMGTPNIRPRCVNNIRSTTSSFQPTPIISVLVRLPFSLISSYFSTTYISSC